jgi:cytochrome b561
MTMPVTSDSAAELGPGRGAELSVARALPRVSTILHWLTAVLVLLMLVSGVLMKQLSGAAVSDTLYTLHKTSGAGILGLVLLRLGYRMLTHARGRWRPGAGQHPVHATLYAALILVPLLGWAGVSDYGARGLFFGLSLPSIWPEGAGYAEWLFLAHAITAFAMFGLVVVHIGIALNDYIQRGGHRS